MYPVRRLAYRMAWRLFRCLPFGVQAHAYRSPLGCFVRRFKKWLERTPGRAPVGPDTLLQEWLARRDRKHRFAWLEATRSTVEAHTHSIARPGIVYVLHDAHPHGAQFNALAQVEGLSKTAGVQVHVAALGDGVLR